MVSGLLAKATGWGEYYNDKSQVYFFLGDYSAMEFSTPPEPSRFASQIAELHQKGTSPNGVFGFPTPTVCGIIERTVTWEKGWAKSITHQLKDAIKYYDETNGRGENTMPLVDSLSM